MIVDRTFDEGELKSPSNRDRNDGAGLAGSSSRLRSGDIGEDAGFTLIELMVVLLILAILLAIAIPTFLGVTKSANDRAAQSNLNTALVNAKSTFQTNSQSYGIGGAANSTTFSTSFAATLATAEPSLSFAVGAVTSGLTPTTLSVSVAGDGNAIVLAVPSKSTGNCFYVIDNAAAEATAAGNGAWSVTGFPATAGTFYGEAKNTGTAPTCSAAAPLAAAAGPPATVVYSTRFPSL
jgi:type IV pilus assembly protein PilA